MIAEVRPELDRRQTILLMSALMLGVALTALDTTIVRQLGRVQLYSWVVASYLKFPSGSVQQLGAPRARPATR